jgi:hypothetical protein
VKNPPRPKVLLPLAVAVALLLVAMPAITGVGRQLRIAVHNGLEVAEGEALVKLRPSHKLLEIEQESDADRSEGVGDGGLRRLHSRTLDTAA